MSCVLAFPDAKEAGTDNRNIVDDGKSQKLTRDDIETLKEQGLKGQVHQRSWNHTHTVLLGCWALVCLVA